jgi:hypothetical protein
MLSLDPANPCAVAIVDALFRVEPGRGFIRGATNNQVRGARDP